MNKFIILAFAITVLVVSSCNKSKTEQIDQKVTQELAEDGVSQTSDMKFVVKDNLFIPENVPMIVDFYATWCGPCKQYEPIFEAMKKKYEGQIIFYRVDAEANPEIAKAYNIAAYPTTVFILPSGGTLGATTGLLTEPQLQTYIDQLLAEVAGEGMSI